MSEYDKLAGQLRQAFKLNPDDIVLSSPLGNVSLNNMPFLKGWRWSVQRIGFPGTEPTLVAGAAPLIIAEFTDEKGWLIGASAFFRSPYGAFTLEADGFTYTVTPLGLQVTQPAMSPNFSNRLSVYNPWTIWGPLFSTIFDPPIPIPYARLLRFTCSLPAGVPIASTRLWLATVGKLYIVDDEEFLESLKKFAAEQLVGKSVDRNI